MYKAPKIKRGALQNINPQKNSEGREQKHRDGVTLKRSGAKDKRSVGGSGLQKTVSRLFSEREKIEGRSASAVQDHGIWISVWYLLQPQAGRSVPVPNRFQVAVR